MAEQILKMAEFGVVGIAVSLIALVAYLLPKFITLLGNHMNHNTQVLTEVRDVLYRLDGTIEKLINKF